MAAPVLPRFVNWVTNQPTTISGSMLQGVVPVVNVVNDFGADPTGTSDSTTAIQNAINSVPNGGIVVLPVGTYKISSTIVIGNGTSSAVSTIQGIYLQGMGIPGAYGSPFFNGFPTTNAPRLLWAGATSGFMIQAAGPLHGWGVRNLTIDGANISSVTGITVNSAGYGDCANLEIVNCAVGIASSSYPLGGYSGVGNVDCIRNNWTNIDIVVPNVGGNKGILLDGDLGGTSDTDYNTFTNCFIRMIAGVANTQGIYLRVCDSNFFNSVNISGGTGLTTTNVAFDYSANNVFPTANVFSAIDSNGTVTQWAIIAGSPSAAALGLPNVLYGIMQANGQMVPDVVNLVAFSNIWFAFTPSPSSNTATFTVNNARYIQMGHSTNVELDITITGGSPTTFINFTLPNTPNSSGGVVGRETVSSSQIVAGSIFGGSTSVNLVKSSLAVFAVNDRIVISGVYENA